MTNPFKNIPGYCGLAHQLPDNDDRLPGYKEQYDKQGWDNTYLWSLDHSIARFIHPKLVALKEYMGIPGGMPQEEWDDIMDTMIASFALKCEDRVLYTPEEVALLDDGLSLFARWYGALWT